MSPSCLLVLFSVKVGLVLSQIAKESKIGELTLRARLSLLLRTIPMSYLVLLQGGAHESTWRGSYKRDVTHRAGHIQDGPCPSSKPSVSCQAVSEAKLVVS